MYTFELNEKEIKKYQRWKKKQLKKQEGIGGMVGGRFGFLFFPTGIGTVVFAVDHTSGEQQDITDYSCW